MKVVRKKDKLRPRFTQYARQEFFQRFRIEWVNDTSELIDSDRCSTYEDVFIVRSEFHRVARYSQVYYAILNICK